VQIPMKRFMICMSVSITNENDVLSIKPRRTKKRHSRKYRRSLSR